MQFDISPMALLVFIGSLLISLTVHEFMHAFVAHQLGDMTASDQGRLSFNPLKHIDPFMTVLLPALLILVHLPPILIAKPVPFDPSQVRHGEFGAALMAAAGPISNLVLAALAAAVFNLGVTGTASDILLIFIQLNIALFIFNLLPIPPLDGSRVLYAFAPEPVQRVMARIESYGILPVFLVILLLSSFISPILATLNQFFFDLLLR